MSSHVFALQLFVAVCMFVIDRSSPQTQKLNRHNLSIHSCGAASRQLLSKVFRLCMHKPGLSMKTITLVVKAVHFVCFDFYTSCSFFTKETNSMQLHVFKII